MDEKDIGGKQPSEDHEKDPKESIPLWLQGLAESEQTDSDEQTDDHHEKADEDADQAIVESAPMDEPVEEGEILPDWLSEIAASEDESLESDFEPEETETAAEQLDGSTDEISTDQAPLQAEIDAQSIEDNPDLDDESFVDLSGMDTENELVPDVEDEIISEEEELPEWLTEMIAEEPASSESEEEAFTEDADLDEDDGSGWQHLEEMPPSWMSFDDATPVNSPEGEVADWLREGSEEDTSPINLEENNSEAEVVIKEETVSSETVTEDTGSFVPIEFQETSKPESDVDQPDTPSDGQVNISEPEKEPEEQQEEPGDSMPKTLRFAKFILDQGEVDRALEIICTYIGQSNYLDEIESWITETIDSGINQNASLWEAVGDIAVAKEEYSEALNAYAKAMKLLMHREEGQNEVN